MSVYAYLDSFQVPGGGAGTTIVRTGYGFKPKVVIATHVGMSSGTSSIATASLQSGFGWATSPDTGNDHASVFLSDVHNADAPAPVYSGQASNLVNFQPTGSLLLQSFNSDGLTLVVSGSAISGSPQLRLLALGGPGITQVKNHFIAIPSSTTSLAYTGVGFKPNAAIFTQISGASGSTVINTASFGAAAGPSGSIVNKAVMVEARNSLGDAGLSALTSRGYLSADSIHLRKNFSVTMQGRVTSWDTDGFTMSWATNATLSTSQTYVLLMRTVPDTLFSLHEVNTATSTGTDINITGVSKPSFGMLYSTKTSSNPTSGLELSGGFFTAAANYASLYTSANGIGSSSVQVGIDFEDCLQFNPDQMRVNSLNSNGVTFRMSSAAASAYPAWVLLGGTSVKPRGSPLIF